MGQKKIGHAGTLDPMAAGVLIVLLGQATKLSSYILENGLKTYLGTACLGVETDTWDMEGNILAKADISGLGHAEIESAISSWTGLREQVVPPFSAAKHQGQPLYRLARRGEDVPVKIKEIKIARAELLACDLPHITFRVTCASGVYIRSLAHSLGKRLGCGAALCGLTREYSHPFGLENSCELADLQAHPQILPDALQPLEAALPGWPQLALAPGEARAVRNGQSVPVGNLAPTQANRAILCEKGDPIALAERDDRRWTILRGLWN